MSVRKNKFWGTLQIIGLYLGALILVINSVQYFLYTIAGIMDEKVVAQELWYRVALKSHIFFGLFAILVGPVQFIVRLRQRYPRFHRIAGYVYAVGVGMSGLTGLVVAQFAIGGAVSGAGMTAGSAFWLYSLWRAMQAILNKDIAGHRKWMLMSYSITFAAVVQRFILGFGMLGGMEFVDIYKISAWLSWFPSIVAALYINEKWVRKEEKLAGVVVGAKR